MIRARKIKSAMLAFAVGLGLVGVTLGTVAQAQTLRWATAGDIQTLDPHAQNEGLTNSFNAHIYERLTARAADLALVPGLAERWERLGPTAWRFHLRQGIQFQDGSAFSADDVLFSIERAKHPNSAVAQYANGLGAVRKVDAHTVELHQAKPNPVLLDHLDAIFIMSRRWSENHNVQQPLSHKAKEESHASRHANGTGPYRLHSREFDVKNVLRQWPGYWGLAQGRFEGNVREVVHLPMASAVARTAALLAGEIDFLLDPAAQDVERLAANPKLKVMQGPENRVIFLGFDQARENPPGVSLPASTNASASATQPPGNPFKSHVVRQAIAHAIDVQALRTHTMRGQSAPAWCLAPSELACRQAEAMASRPRFDIEQAKKLLAQAGYPNGFDTPLDCPNNRFVNDEALCIAISGMLAKVNVRVRVNAMPKAQFFQRLEKLESAFYLMGWGGAETDAQPTMDPLMHSFEASTSKGEDNYGRFANPALDALIDAAATEADPAKRAGMVTQALALHSHQIHHLVLHRQALVWAMQKTVSAMPAANNHFRAWMARVN